MLILPRLSISEIAPNYITKLAQFTITSFKGSKEAKKLKKKRSQTELIKEALARKNAEDNVKKVMWNSAIIDI